MQLYQLTTPEEVDTFLQQFPLGAVFKAGTCHKTMQGFSVLETFLRQHDLPVGIIRVVEWRPASNHVASLSGVVHQSPQFILFKNGQAVFDVDNWDITPEALAPVFEQHVPRLEGEREAISGNVEPYRDLIRRYLNGQLSDAMFQDAYVTLFRDDASLRGKQEFELLSRLFGDPDAYHGGLHQLGEPQSRGDLRARASELLQQLETL
ncbi:bacillithiol system protein YtxJ [Deinobacterium chartae]|uniref:Bacillithiol system protein YtxJ n=1 Tax=Deinobacterium chartae TaxID=521158 RepID=A0A841I0L2_9DEIO|nr:monothiol bacilliredoxin BrxC family protein [Deinobacterium chartae]MBB6097515.1 bacillithiol system protein YtxJ [Deinobacterium chartae]